MTIDSQFFIETKNFLKKISNKYLLPNTGKLNQLQVQIKKDNSKVTQYDLILENELTLYFNNKGFNNIISEETNYKIFNFENYLTIDPIDGTKNFIDGIKKFVIMISYIQNNNSIFSIIYNPSDDSFYHCFNNQVFKNFNIINNFVYSALIGHLNTNAKSYYKNLINSYIEIPRSRSIGYDVIEILEGNRSLISFYKCKIWDLFPALSFIINLNFNSNHSSFDFSLETLDRGLIFYAKI